MTRFRRIAAAAAALFIAGGITIYDAWQDANTADVNPFAKPQLKEKFRQMETGRKIEVFLLIAQGYTPPMAFDPTGPDEERWIGDCQQGACSIEFTSKVSYSYGYRITGLVNGWRLAVIRAHPYIVGSWKKLAADEASVVFLGRRRDVHTNCVATVLTGAQCRNLANELDPCWAGTGVNDGTNYRNGLVYGPGIGGDQAATLPTPAEVNNGTWLWRPCEVSAGERPQRVAENAVPPDAELDFDVDEGE